MRLVAAPIVLAAALAATASADPDRTQTATGTIVNLQASERLVVVALAGGGEDRFLWNAQTKITGVLAIGARVTVRYAAGPDGRNLAQQIIVSRG